MIDRFAQLRPTVLVIADGYNFNGRTHSRVEALDELREGLPTVEHVILLERLSAEVDVDRSRPDGWLSWEEAVSAPGLRLRPVAVPFDHPMWVLFSSGTTGLPKGLVHGHGGFLVETLKLGARRGRRPPAVVDERRHRHRRRVRGRFADRADLAR